MLKNKRLLIAGALLIAAFTGMFLKPQTALAADNVNLSFTSRGACLMDYKTGTLIFEYKSANRVPIASMVKIMTLDLIYKDIEAGKLGYDDMITVSGNAASMGGSQAFLDAHKQYKVSDLITSITIASANDSCVAMAEHLDGSVEGFVNRMNAKAAELGMENTKFANCTGLPSEGEQYSCAKDAALMLRDLIGHEGYFNFSKIWMKDLVHEGGRITGLTNTNKLIRAYEGCDGGKTGFTDAALHCLAATAQRGGMRLISVAVGAPDSKTRFAEVSKLLNYGFANYANKIIVAKDRTMEQAIPVVFGRQKDVTARTAEEFTVFGSKAEAGKGITTETEFYTLDAPVMKDAAVGKMKIVKDGVVIGEVSLIANDTVLRKTFGDIFNDMMHLW